MIDFEYTDKFKKYVEIIQGNDTCKYIEISPLEKGQIVGLTLNRTISLANYFYAIENILVPNERLLSSNASDKNMIVINIKHYEYAECLDILDGTTVTFDVEELDDNKVILHIDTSIKNKPST